MKKLVLGTLGYVLLALPSLSFAIPLTWTYSGTCAWGDCDEVSSITGVLTADPALYGSGSQINEYALFGDLIDYSFTVGNYSFSGSSGLGTYWLDGLGNITGGSMTFANLFSLEFLGVGSASWSIVDKDCVWFTCRVAVEAGGAGGYTSSVPEPGTLGLFGIALLGVGLSARRKKAVK